MSWMRKLWLIEVTFPHTKLQEVELPIKFLKLFLVLDLFAPLILSSHVWIDKDNNSCSQDKNHVRSGFHFAVIHFVTSRSAHWVIDCLFSDFGTIYQYKFLSALCNRHHRLTTQFQLLLSNKTLNFFHYPSLPQAWSHS